MDMRRMRYFMAVAEELHFGRAAQRLNMTQPPLSEQIRKLEEDLGITLFDRNSRGVALTDSGRVFLDGARKAIEELERASQAAQQAEQGMLGLLNVGYVSSGALSFLPRLLRHLKKSIPGLVPQLREISSWSSVDALRREVIDVALLRTPAVTEELTCRRIARERVVAAMPDDHPLAHGKAVRLSALRNELFVLSPPNEGSASHSITQRMCSTAGFTPRLVQFVQNAYASLGLVASGFGIALVPSSMSALAIEGLVFREIADVEDYYDLSVAWRTDDARPLVRRAVEQICLAADSLAS